MPNYPAFMDGLMNTTPGSIDRRYPKYWHDNEGGIDWIAGSNNNIISLTDGEIVGAGYFCSARKQFFLSSPDNCPDNSQGGGYGVVTIRTVNSDGTKTDIYYQHILISSAIKLTANGSRKQLVKKGQIIGHANPHCNIEMGVNVWTAWGGIWGTSSPGPHIDPEVYLRKLANNYGSNTKTTGLGGTQGTSSESSKTTIANVATQAHEILNNTPGFIGIIEAIDKVEQFVPYQANTSVDTSKTTFDSLVSDKGPITFCLSTDCNCLYTNSNTSFGNKGPDYASWVNCRLQNVNPSFNSLGSDPSSIIQSILQFIMDNTIAFVFRSFVIILGLIILIGLMLNALQTVSQVTTGSSLQENIVKAVA